MDYSALLKVVPFAALFAAIKWYLGYRVSVKALDLKYLDLVDKLKYSSEDAKTNFVHSSIFTNITKRTTCIHHINLMFNSYDPRRLLVIYSKAPGFVAFSHNDVIKPRKLSNPFAFLILCLLLIIMVLAPLVFLRINHIWPTPTTIPHYNLYGALLMCLFSIYGTKEAIFLLEVIRYYNDKKVYTAQQS